MMIHPLLPELIRLQRRDRYLAPDALSELSRQLEIPVNRIISVASFYQAFRFKPCGKHQIKVCIGAACYVKGAEKVRTPRQTVSSRSARLRVWAVACWR